MKTRARFGLGIFLGAICGAVIASLILQLPTVRQTIGIYAFDFEITFGRAIGENIFTVLKILGTLAGAAVAGSLAVSIRWFAVFGTLLVGIVIGGTIMFFVEVRVVKYVSGTWEQSYADQRVYDYLQCLRAIDRVTTNNLDLVRFQNIGRMVLTNYICEMEKLNADEHGAISGTNTSAYKVAKKYLATHTNSLPIGNDF